jgi:hypothetical protein
MKEIEYIVGIYNYVNPSPDLGNESAFYLLYLLDEKGMLERDIAEKLFAMNFDEVGKDAEKIPGAIGPFLSLDKVNQYAFALCEELNAAKVSLLSVEEYNTLFENTQLAPDFHRDLLEKGNVMENIERKKKGFLGRFFS